LRLQNAYYYWSQLRDVILAITNVDGLIVAKDSSFSPSPPHRAAPRSIPLSSPHQSHRRGRLRRHARRGWPRSSPAEATSAAALSEDGPALRAPPLYSASCVGRAPPRAPPQWTGPRAGPSTASCVIGEQLRKTRSDAAASTAVVATANC
jgi:hypothetical protein